MNSLTDEVRLLPNISFLVAKRIVQEFENETIFNIDDIIPVLGLDLNSSDHVKGFNLAINGLRMDRIIRVISGRDKARQCKLIDRDNYFNISKYGKVKGSDKLVTRHTMDTAFDVQSGNVTADVNELSVNTGHVEHNFKNSLSPFEELVSVHIDKLTNEKLSLIAENTQLKSEILRLSSLITQKDKILNRIHYVTTGV